MIKELEQLQQQFNNQAVPNDTMSREEFKAWLDNPYTKLLYSEVRALYMDVLESIDDNAPIDTVQMVEHANRFGQRKAYENLLNYDPFPD